MHMPGRLTDAQLARIPRGAAGRFRDMCCDDAEAAATRLVRAGVRESARIGLLMGLLDAAGTRHPRVTSWLAVRVVAAASELAAGAAAATAPEAVADAVREELTRQANYVAMLELDAVMTAQGGTGEPPWGAPEGLVDDAEFAALLRRARLPPGEPAG